MNTVWSAGAQDVKFGLIDEARFSSPNYNFQKMDLVFNIVSISVFDRSDLMGECLALRNDRVHKR